MESCGRRRSRRPGLVSWCDDSPSRPSLCPDVFPGLLPPAEGRTSHSLTAKRLRPHPQSCCRSQQRVGADGDSDGRRPQREGGPAPLRPEDGSVNRPRCSWIISRRRQGGGASQSSPSGVDPVDPSPPAPGSPSLEQRGSLKSSGTQEVRSRPRCSQPPGQRQEKQRCTSASANLSRLLSGLQQRQAKGSRGPGPTGSRGPRPGDTALHHAGRQRCSGVPDFSTDVLQAASELEKENAHLVVVDLVLEVLEAVKWSLNSSADPQGHTHSWTCTQQHTNTQASSHTCSAAGPPPRDTHVHSSPPSTCTENLQPEAGTGRRSVFEGGRFGEDEAGAADPDDPDDPDVNYDSLSSAERLAQQLVLEFKRSWCPSRRSRRGQLSLRSSLQELPGSGGVAQSSSRLKEEIRLRTRIRGSLNWTPPRLQIIFTVWPPHRRSEVVALQHFLCAGCGTALEPRYMKKLRYCEYLGRYFCDCCHSGSEAVIPARVLSCWDFSRFPVCDLSRQLLDSLWFQPLVDLSCEGKKLQGRVKELDRFTELQEQLRGVKKLLAACRFSESVLLKFQQLPAHLMEDKRLFSLDDLLRVKKGQLLLQFRAVLHGALDHVESCQLCLARGFICEFCGEKDVIFPFQTHICKRCEVCRACFHKHCFLDKKCPRCIRMESWKNIQKE